MKNYIQKDIKRGWNDYILDDQGVGKDVQMTVQILSMSKGETVSIEDDIRETAVLVLEGKGSWKVRGRKEIFDRENQFACSCFCIHAAHGDRIELNADKDCLFYVQRTVNENIFEPVFYTPKNVESVIAGDKGELDGTMKRVIRTIFDYRNAPYSNMVLGEVVNNPGLWSSYPPHHHPQPEVYFYRFDKEQGFGAGFGNGEVYKTGQNGLLVIQEGFHSQVTAPGYTMCYVWGIRHLEQNPWLNTRIDDEEHRWMLDEKKRNQLYS